MTAGPPGRFGAVLTAMVTPFDDEGRLDLDGVATLARYLTDHGNEGLVIAGTTGESARLLAEAPDGFELYSGDDAMTLALLAIGACGAVGVATHWCGEQTAEMIAAFTKGDVALARTINARLTESWAFETGDDAPNPIPSKAVLRVLGLPAGQCRLPMGPAPDGLEDQARRVLRNLGIEPLA